MYKIAIASCVLLLTSCTTISNVTSSTVEVKTIGYAVRKNPQFTRDGDTNVAKKVDVIRN